MVGPILMGLGFLAVLVIVFLIFVALRPTSFHVARSTVIEAPPAAVFAHVNDFRKWPAWSPYDKRDPAMQRTYTGPPEGVGASYAWNGNNEVGEGRSTITESRANELIVIRLEFKRPFAATNTAEFTFQAADDITAVTWSLRGQYNFVTKAVGLFLNMDKMIGGDFETGLANLKRAVEAQGSAKVAVH